MMLDRIQTTRAEKQQKTVKTLITVKLKVYRLKKTKTKSKWHQTKPKLKKILKFISKHMLPVFQLTLQHH